MRLKIPPLLKQAARLFQRASAGKRSDEGEGGGHGVSTVYIN